MDIGKEIKTAARILKKYHGKKLILYGSYADGTANESSDIDLAVEIPPEFFFKYYVELEERLSKPVDLRLLSSLTDKFRERVERKGVLCVG